MARIIGTADNDELGGTLAADLIQGLSGNDTIYTSGFDTVLGGFGNDTIYTDWNVKTVDGGAGNDRIVIKNAQELWERDIIIDGGAGIDTLDLSTVSPQFANLYFRNWPVFQPSGDEFRLADYVIRGIEIIKGGDYGNDFWIDRANDIKELHGGAGADSFWANHSRKLYGYGGDDRFLKIGSGTLAYGGDGNDSFSIEWADGIRLWGGTGVDTVNFERGTVDLQRNTYSDLVRGAGRIYEMENVVIGANFADGKVLGNGEANDLSVSGIGTFGVILDGRGGDDRLNGGFGDDIINGGAGHDILIVSGGKDILDGSSGIDTISFENVTGNVFATLSSTNIGQFSINEQERGTVINVENVIGGRGNDQLIGNDASNRLDGGLGDDTLHGGSGNDTLLDSYGFDTFHGGAGKDRFLFESLDAVIADPVTARILDFRRAEDIIDLRTIDANDHLVGDQAFRLIAMKNFSGRAGELRFDIADGSTFVQGDVNGDAVADFTIQVDGGLFMQAGDFRL